MAKKPSTQITSQGEEEPGDELPTSLDDNDLGDLEVLIEEQLESVPEEQRAQIVRRVLSVVKAEYFSGPLPHPNHLREYDEVLPGAADRIISMAESALQHNIRSADQAQSDDDRYRRLGMWLGFSALVLLLIGAIGSALIGNNWLAGLFLGTSVVSVVGRFIVGRRGN